MEGRIDEPATHTRRPRPAGARRRARTPAPGGSRRRAHVRAFASTPRARLVAPPRGRPPRPGSARVAAGAAVKAVVRTRYGGPEVVELREVDRPEVADDGVLVEVRAASLNRADWYALAGPLVARA